MLIPYVPLDYLDRLVEFIHNLAPVNADVTIHLHSRYVTWLISHERTDDARKVSIAVVGKRLVSDGHNPRILCCKRETKSLQFLKRMTRSKSPTAEITCGNAMFDGNPKETWVKDIFDRLIKLYPEPVVELDFTTPFELLIASLLAAQNRDTTINKLTVELFKKYRSPADYIAAPTEELEEDIKLSGFFRQKTKAIKALSQKLVDDFGGAVPETMDELLTLPGIGRKTANVILGYAMSKPAGIVVDTHHLRVTPLLGLNAQKLADKMEKEMIAIVPEKDWLMWSTMITLHGRRVCVAKRPKCEICVLNDICPSSLIRPENQDLPRPSQGSQ